MLSAEEVKARATSPIEACKVSIEEWQYKAELPATDLAYAGWGAERCGLCEFFGPGFICNDSDKGTCPLCAANKADLNLEYGCCAEYSTAKTAWHNFKDGQATVAEVRSAFWAMVARLEKELTKLEAAQAEEIRLLADEAEKLKQETKKAEIRHGDLGITDLRNAGVVIGYEKPQFFMSNDVRHGDINKDITWLDINIFDVMAKAMKGKKEYIAAGIDFKLVGDTIKIDQYCFSSPDNVAGLLKAVVSLVIQQKRAEAQKCKP